MGKKQLLSLSALSPQVTAEFSSGSGSPNHGLWFWTGAPCSPQRTPDFQSSLLALAKFMRLSLMKAAHAGVAGAPCRKPGYMGRKRISSNAFTQSTRVLAPGRSLFSGVVALEGAAPHLFGPRTLWRTWGTRPEKGASLPTRMTNRLVPLSLSLRVIRA
jgi:hypothetical protein